MTMKTMLQNFNSIKVQFKLAFADADEGVAEFQFHKGSIQTNVKYKCFFVLYYFNSIKVQFKLSFTTS